MRSPAFKITVSLCALLATIVAAVPNTLDARTTCYSGVFIIVSRGSEETQGESVLEGIATAIKDAIPNSGSDEVVYPALLSFWNSAPTGATNLQSQLTDYQAACPDGKIVLLGYSQGCYVITTALAGGNYSDESWTPISSDVGDNIAAIVMFGDMSRVVGADFTMASGTNCLDPCTDTAPLALTSPYKTAMADYDDRLEEWCDAEDPVCCSSGTNVTAHLSYWSDNTTDTAVDFVQKLVGSAVSGSSSVSSTASSTASSSAWSSTSISSTASSTASTSAWSSTSSSAASYTSSPASSSAIESSIASALSTALTSKSGSVTESGTTANSSTGSATASTTATGSTAVSTAASTEPSAATASASTSASASGLTDTSTSDGSRTTFSALLASCGLLMCSALLSMRLLA